MSVKSFEDCRWTGQDQSAQYSWMIVDKLLEGSPNGSVLDCGGGDGSFLARHLDRGKNRILNVDISSIAVHKALEKGVPSECLDIEKDLPNWNGGKFNYALMLDVLEHTITPDLMLRNVIRIADRIIIVTPNFANIKFRLQLLFGVVPDECKEKKGHCFFFTKKKLWEVIERNSLKVVETKYYFIGQNNPFLRPVSFILGKLFPSLMATEFIIECWKDNTRSPYDIRKEAWHEPTQDMLAGENHAN